MLARCKILISIIPIEPAVRLCRAVSIRSRSYIRHCGKPESGVRLNAGRVPPRGNAWRS